MADKFKVPVAVFFFPDPPDIEPISESFRTLPEAQFEQIPRRLKLLLRKAKALQLSLSELANERNPSDHLTTRDLSFAVDAPIEEVADAVREYLGITLDQQMSWPSTGKALDSLNKDEVYKSVAFERTGLWGAGGAWSLRLRKDSGTSSVIQWKISLGYLGKSGMHTPKSHEFGSICVTPLRESDLRIRRGDACVARSRGIRHASLV